MKVFSAFKPAYDDSVQLSEHNKTSWLLITSPEQMHGLELGDTIKYVFPRFLQRRVNIVVGISFSIEDTEPEDGLHRYVPLL